MKAPEVLPSVSKFTKHLQVPNSHIGSRNPLSGYIGEKYKTTIESIGKAPKSQLNKAPNNTDDICVFIYRIHYDTHSTFKDSETYTVDEIEKI